jgi:hypothetical protein
MPAHEWSRANRDTARRDGQTTYHGDPCSKQDHVCRDGTTIRYTKGSACHACQAASKRSYDARERARAGQVERLEVIAPDKPSNPIPGNGWPFGGFEDDPRAVFDRGTPGKRINEAGRYAA